LSSVSKPLELPMADAFTWKKRNEFPLSADRSHGCSESMDDGW